MKTVEEHRTITLFGNGFNQFGKQVLMTQMDFHILECLYAMDEEETKFDYIKVNQEKEKILQKIKMKEEIRYTPFILSARGGIEKHRDHWEIQSGARLQILDGRYRLLGFQAALRSLQEKRKEVNQENKPRLVKKIQAAIDQMNAYPISLQIYLNLSSSEETKLFNDTHFLDKREIHSWVTMQYDQRDYLTTLTRKLACKFEHRIEIEQTRSRLTDQSSALTSLTTIKKCLLAMWEGELTGKAISRTSAIMNTQTAEKRSEEFMETCLKLFPKQASNRIQYVTGLSSIQIALAYSFHLLTNKGKVSHQEAIQQFSKLTCTWKHQDPLFAHLYEPTTGRIRNHLTKKTMELTAQQFISQIERKGHQS